MEGRKASKSYGRFSIFMVLVIMASFIVVTPKLAYASSTMLIGAVPEEATTVVDHVFAQNQVQFTYISGYVTLSTCPDAACSWAIDDEAFLIVDHQDTSQSTRSFVSMTIDKDAEDITDMFEPGVNTVTIQLIDRMGPVRGNPRPLYLVASPSSPPIPDLGIADLPLELQRFLSHQVMYSSDPVNTLTGSFTLVSNDVSIPGRGPTIEFTRYYDSSNDIVGALGPGWWHSYESRLAHPDAMSDDIVVVRTDGKVDLYTYDSGDYLPPEGATATLIKNGNGTYSLTEKNLTRWDYTERGELIRIRDRYGNQSVLSYNASGELTSVSDPAGRGSLAFTYDDGLLIEIEDWINRAVTFGYDGNDRLSTITDRENNITTYGYDSTSHRITTITDANSNVVITNVYDMYGRVESQKDARGLTTGQEILFDYNDTGGGTQLTVVQYPETSDDPMWNLVEEDSYDANGRITQRVTKPTSSSSDWITEAFTYNGDGFRNSYTDGRGNTTLYCYDVDYSGVAISGSRGNLTRQIDPSPTSGAPRPTTLFMYDADSNLIELITPKGVTSSSGTNCTTDLSTSINTTYVTEYEYDSGDKTLVSITQYYTDPDLGAKTAVTKFEYNDSNNPGLQTEVIPPSGNTSSTPDYSYATLLTYGGSGSMAGMLIQKTSPIGAITTYEYDAVGRLTSMVEPRGNDGVATPAHFEWEYEYDDEDRLRFVKAPAPVAMGAQLVTEYRYDDVGNQTIVIDANGQVTKYVYDVRNQLSEVHQSPDVWTNPASTPTNEIVTLYEYDHLGNLSRVTRADGTSDERVTDYAYDGLGRLVKETEYPSWPTTTPTLVREYTYDKVSNRTSVKDPLNKTTSYGYDALNRQTSITYNSIVTSDVTYTYDNNGNRTSMVDGTGTTSYAYDEVNKLLSVTNPGSKVVGYRYDTNGNRTKVIYPDTTAVSYTYDKANRLVSVVDWSSRTTSYQYFIDGSVEKVTNINNTSANYIYDNVGRLTQVWHRYGANGTITQHTYTLDSVGNRIREDAVLTDGYCSTCPIDPDRQGFIEYTYDGLYRVTSEDRQLPNPQDEEVLDYSYDRVGNRTSLEVFEYISELTEYTYDKADRIIEATGEEEEEFTVNANGNIIARDNLNHVYDQADRLIKTEVVSIGTTYTYDGDGNLLETFYGMGPWPTKIRSYIYDVNRPLPVILVEQTENTKYVWGLDGPLYTVDSSNKVGVYHLDGLGSMRAISDIRSGDPRVQMYLEYSAYGTEGYSNRTFEQDLTFTGEVLDSNTSYMYLRARFYDPKIGRFLSRDTIGGNIMRPQSLNRFSYTENNPVNYIDPSGHILVSQALEGFSRMAGGIATMFLGGVMLSATPATLGASIPPGAILIGYGGYEIGAGGGLFGNALKDVERKDIRTPVGAIASRVTDDDQTLGMIDAASSLFTYSPYKLTGVPQLLEWFGNIGDLTQIFDVLRVRQAHGFEGGNK